MSVRYTPGTSCVFLVPFRVPDGGMSEFHRNFGRRRDKLELGYDIAIVSDYYGLRGQPDSAVESYLTELFANAAKFEGETGITPRLVFDIEGFRANTNLALRERIESSEFMAGWHVFDEPDAHLTGKPDEVARNLSGIESILRGTINKPYQHPLWMTFENQAGKPSARQWNYIGNTDDFYRGYRDLLELWAPGCHNVFGVDYYLFTRSLTPPTSQVSTGDMVSYFANLIGVNHEAFSWTETTWQGLSYIRNNPGNHGRGPTVAEVWAQIWLAWAAGQRGLRGDFNYIFWDGSKEVTRPNGLTPEMAGLVLDANNLQRRLERYLQSPNILWPTTSPDVRASSRFYFEDGKIRLLFIIVNQSAQSVPMVGSLTLPIFGTYQFGRVDVEGVESFTKEGWYITGLAPYEVRIMEGYIR